MVVDVVELTPDETVRLDPSRLGDLYLQLGEAGAEDVVCRAALQTALHIGFFLRSAQRVLFAQLFLKESAIGFRVSVVACANTDGRVFRIADPLVNGRGSDTILYF